MTINEFDQLSTQLLALPSEQRLALGELLLDSVDDLPCDEFGDELNQEISRRVEEIKNGTAQCFSSEEVHEEIRRRIALL